MDFDALRRRQLDDQLKALRSQDHPVRPEQGWIRTIREGLGMSLRQLGKRAGLTKASVAQMEQREAKGTITLNSIRKLAEAMDSDFVYFLLPRGGLEETVRRRADLIARRLAKEVSDSMALEDQATSADRLQQLVEFHAARLLRDGGALWEDV